MYDAITYLERLHDDGTFDIIETEGAARTFARPILQTKELAGGALLTPGDWALLRRMFNQARALGRAEGRAQKAVEIRQALNIRE